MSCQGFSFDAALPVNLTFLVSRLSPLAVEAWNSPTMKQLQVKSFVSHRSHEGLEQITLSRRQPRTCPLLGAFFILHGGVPRPVDASRAAASSGTPAESESAAESACGVRGAPASNFGSVCLRLSQNEDFTKKSLMHNVTPVGEWYNFAWLDFFKNKK